MTNRRIVSIGRRVLGERVWAGAKAVQSRFYQLDRNPRNRLLKRLPRQAICAEVGVWKGDFSVRIQRRTKPRMLHLIDPWYFEPNLPDRWYGGVIAKSQRDMDQICHDVKTRFANAPNVKIHRGTSSDILSQFDDCYFDWIYVDADHRFASVLSDLRLCLAKTKPGGLVAGDDYTWGSFEGYPVRQAVKEVVDEYGLSESLTILRSQFIIELPGSTTSR